MTGFLTDCWYVAATSEEVGEELFARKILGKRLLFYRKQDGEPVAVSELCPHRFASLAGGRRIGDLVQCPYHGLRFDSSGACVLNPHGGLIPPNARLQTRQLFERDGYVWIWGNEESAGDPSTIPDLYCLHGAESYSAVADRLHVNANYRLIIDNLLDLTHVTYLHPSLSGSADGDASFGGQTRLEAWVEQEGNRVISRNRAYHMPVSPHFRHLWAQAPELGDLYGDMHWLPASVLLFKNGMNHCGGRPGVDTVSLHLLTPETESSTHYFWQMSRNSLIGDVNVDHALKAGINYAFQCEDEPMITQIHANMAGADLMDLRPAILASDRAAIRARRILQQMIGRQKAEP